MSSALRVVQTLDEEVRKRFAPLGSVLYWIPPATALSFPRSRRKDADNSGRSHHDLALDARYARN